MYDNMYSNSIEIHFSDGATKQLVQLIPALFIFRKILHAMTYYFCVFVLL
jgi:hypothetical protein